MKQDFVLIVCVIALLIGYSLAAYSLFILHVNSGNTAFVMVMTNVFVAILSSKYGGALIEKIKSIVGPQQE